MMKRLIPILPARHIEETAGFYQALGFRLVKQYDKPTAYIVVSRAPFILHFYGSRAVEPEKNSTMCALEVDDLEGIHTSFTEGLRRHLGRLPRNGFPRLSKIRDLSEDRRFTLVDPSGNTFYVLSKADHPSRQFFRTIDNPERAAKFALFYDVVHSKEDWALARKWLPWFLKDKDAWSEVDQAKLLLLAMEISKGEKRQVFQDGLDELLRRHQSRSAEWKRIQTRLLHILDG